MATLDFLTDALKEAEHREPRTYGIGTATVINNIDMTGEARVQVSLHGIPGVLPWARLVTPSAGRSRGIYFVPQVGDEVVVAFNHGDTADAYVLGGLWSTLDRPPALLPTDPVTKRTIVTPTGQTILIDDLEQSVTITNTTKQKLALELDAVTLEAGTPLTPGLASIKLDSLGNVTIEGALSITMKAPKITLDGTLVKVSGTAGASLESSGDCVVKGALVRIN